MILLVQATAAAAASLHAQPDATQSPPGTIVVTGERLPAGAAEVQGRPGGTDLVSAEDYEDKVAVSLREALAFSPGVYSQPRFGQEIRLSIRGSGISRGFHMRGLTLLQDGIPINLADDNGDFQELDPAILGHLEVYRGANAFRFGGSTLGGAVNGVTPIGRTSPRFRLRMDGGSFGTSRGFASHGWSGRKSDAWIGISGDRSKGEREHSERSSLRAHANVGLMLAEGVATRFYASGNHINQELPGALPHPLVIEAPKTGNVAGHQQRDIDSLRIQNRTNVDLADLSLEFGAFVNAKALFHPIFQVVDQKSLDRGAFGRAGWESGPLKLLAGMTARFGTVHAQRFVNIDGERGAETFTAYQYARTIDVYSEARRRFGVATLIAGAIYTNGMRRQEQSFPLVTAGKANFNQLSPRLGVLWQPNPKLDIYASVSRSHELPGFIELAQLADFVPLKAQHAWTAEAGARGEYASLRFDVSVYRATVRNELLQFSVGPDIPASTFNADRTLHQGIEAGLEVTLAPWAQLRQVYQFNDFRFRDDRQYGDKRLPVIPKHQYRTEIRISGKDWHVSPSLEWVPHGAWADFANSFKAAGYATIGASGAVALTPQVEAFADVRNIANRKAVGDISAVTNYASLLPSHRAIFYPVEGRAVFAGVRARW